MTLYCKAGPDGTSIGDCPFCHAVRLLLEEKGLAYELQPATQETKPQWLLEHYEGKMPALRHGKECYVDSAVICEYLDFFFNTPSSSNNNDALNQAMEGFFPALAKYLKHVPTDDETETLLRDNLTAALSKLDAYLQQDTAIPSSDKPLSVADCRLAPLLYHASVGLPAFKGSTAPTIPARVQQYMDAVFARASFQATLYPASTVEWGWGNARAASGE